MLLLQVLGAILALGVTDALLASSGGPQLAFLVAAIGGLAKGAIGKAVGGAIGRAGKWVGRQVGGNVRAAATGAAVTYAAGRVNQFVGGGRGGPPPLPRLAPQGPQRGGVPVPREGPIGRTISRILPGGLTGREFTPFEGTEYDKMGRPIAVYPDTREQQVAPPGYVLVDGERIGMEPGTRLAVLKPVARALGVWKGRPKPPVSGYDLRAITRARSAQGRVKKLAGMVGLKTARKG